MEIKSAVDGLKQMRHAAQNDEQRTQFYPRIKIFQSRRGRFLNHMTSLQHFIMDSSSFIRSSFIHSHSSTDWTESLTGRGAEHLVRLRTNVFSRQMWRKHKPLHQFGISDPKETWIISQVFHSYWLSSADSRKTSPQFSFTEKENCCWKSHEQEEDCSMS